MAHKHCTPVPVLPANAPHRSRTPRPLKDERWMIHPALIQRAPELQLVCEAARNHIAAVHAGDAPLIATTFRLLEAAIAAEQAVRE